MEEDLFEAEILDSLSFVDLLMHIEQEFDIRISIDELEDGKFSVDQKDHLTS
jgi:acyl carrier protein